MSIRHLSFRQTRRREHARCEEILTIQAMGLKKRLAHTGAKSAVVGISGGLDSTLALLITARAFDMLGIPRENILSSYDAVLRDHGPDLQQRGHAHKEAGCNIKRSKYQKSGVHSTSRISDMIRRSMT